MKRQAERASRKSSFTGAQGIRSDSARAVLSWTPHRTLVWCGSPRQGLCWAPWHCHVCTKGTVWAADGLVIFAKRYIRCLVGGSPARLLWPAWPAFQAQVLHPGGECRSSPATSGHSTGLGLSLPVSPHSCTLPCGFLVRAVAAGETPRSAGGVTALVRTQSPMPQAVLQNGPLFHAVSYRWCWLWCAGFSQPFTAMECDRGQPQPASVLQLWTLFNTNLRTIIFCLQRTLVEWPWEHVPQEEPSHLPPSGP